MSLTMLMVLIMVSVKACIDDVFDGDLDDDDGGDVSDLLCM